VSTTNTFKLSAGGVIKINDSFGYVNVQGWDRPDVEVTVTKSTQTRIGDKGQTRNKAHLDHFRVTTEHPSDAELVISTVPSSHGLIARAKRGILIEYQIRAPHDAKLAIHHDSGYVLVSDMTADIEATSRFGDIFLMLPHLDTYSVDAKTKFGGVYTDYADPAHLRHLIGTGFDRTAKTTPNHRMFLRVGMGGITITEVPAKPDAPMVVSGD